jgi:hypothetical protein
VKNFVVLTRRVDGVAEAFQRLANPEVQHVALQLKKSGKSWIPEMTLLADHAVGRGGFDNHLVPGGTATSLKNHVD